MRITLLKSMKMKTVKKVLLSMLLMALTTTIQAQREGTLPSNITEATRDGDAVELANYFNDKIELVLPSKAGVFSKQQAQFMMKDFFTSFAPRSFQIIHQGVRENATFAIGKYTHANGSFRILFLTKNDGGETLIHQLRIEQQDE